MSGPLLLRRGLAAAVVAAVLAAWPAAGVDAAPAEPAVGRVLVLSLPGVTWASVGDARVPHLEGLFLDSAVGSTSVRTIRRHTFPGDGYATLGAGTAAAGVSGLDGLAFGIDEPFEDGTAGDAYRRRTGRAAPGPVVSLAGRALAQDADRRHRGAEIGIFGETLARAGVDRAVIANADDALTDRRVGTFHREAVLALADRHGALPGGDVSRELLRPDPDGAFGISLDPDATLAAFSAAWAGPVDRRAVVLLEASDLARVNAYRAHTSEPRFRALFRSALERTDALVGRVLADVDPNRDAVVVVAPSDPGDGVHLTVAALRAPGVAPGLLNSASTRRAGFVMQTDLAPTVLARLGIERPDSMEGRPYKVEGPPRQNEQSAAFPLSRFVEADREARFRDRMFAPVAATYVTVEILLSLAAALAIALTRGPIRPGLRRGLSFVALWLMAVVPVTFLPSVLDIATAGPYLLFVIGGAAALAGVTAALTRVVVGAGRGGSARARLWPMAALLGLLLALQIGDVLTGSHLQISTVFGYSPIVGGRFAGFGNLSFGQVATAAILLAGILAHLLGRRWGVRAALAVLAVTLVADGMPIWGSDVGGVLAAVPAFSLVALRLTGRKAISKSGGIRRFLALAGGAVAAVVAFGLLDLSRPAPERTHLGRLFEQIGQDGLGPLTDAIVRKIGANLAVLPTSIWVPLVPSVLAFLAWLAWGKSPRLEMLRARAPELRTAFVGVLVAAVLGFALNDSGIAVPAMMLGVLNPVLVYLTVHWDAAELAPSAAGEPPRAESQRWAVDEPGAELRVGKARLP